ncbi:MAG: hypothetical protein AAYR33_09010 [Acetobacteraceae bacterium]
MATTWIVLPGDNGTGWNKWVNGGDALIFQPKTVGGNITVNGGGRVQLNADVIIRGLTINDGDVYSSGQGPTIDGLTINGGRFQMTARTTLLNNITLNWGDSVSWAGGPVYYNASTILMINAGKMRMPTPEVLDNSGPLRVNLGSGGHFETYAKDLDHYYFNVTGDSFNIDIIDLKYWGKQVSSITPNSSGITIHLTNGNSLTLNGNFPRGAMEGGP